MDVINNNRKNTIKFEFFSGLLSIDLFFSRKTIAGNFFSFGEGGTVFKNLQIKGNKKKANKKKGYVKKILEKKIINF